MEFKKYSKITPIKKSTANYLYKKGFGDIPFVVQEKIHGTNFSFCWNGKEMTPASHGMFLKLTTKFYGYQCMYEKLLPKILKICAELKSDNIRIYGEYFGGKYMHDDVKSDPTATLIQHEVQYTPLNKFCGFDIRVDDYYLSVIRCNELFDKFGIYRAQILKQGSAADCLTYPNDFPTKISQYFGYPDIEGNICEGTIIRSLEYKSLPNQKRCIFKNKNRKFQEHKKPNNKLKLERLSDKANDMFNIARGYITYNRLSNVVGHQPLDDDAITPVFGELAKRFAKDVFNDFLEDHSDSYNELANYEQIIIKKDINKLSNRFLGRYIKAILDGEFKKQYNDEELINSL